MSDFYKKGNLRAIIRNAKEAVLVYRPDLGLATRTAFYFDNPTLKGLIISELLEAKEMSHGLEEHMTIDACFKFVMNIEEEHEVLETPLTYVSDGEVEYHVFTSAEGNLLISKRMMKAIKPSMANTYYTNEKRDRLIIKREEQIIAIIMAFKVKDTEQDKINQLEW